MGPMAQDRVFGFGLIGAGAISTMHATVIDCLPDARLVGVTALPFEAAEEFARARGVRACRSVEELLADPSIDVVAIGTPSGLHPDQTVACARAGKHVLCEKPLAITLEGADRAIRAAEEAGLKLAVVSQRRFDPPCVAVRRAIEEGVFGRIVLVNGIVRYFREPSYYTGSNWRGTWALDGGGALINQGIHMVDMVRWFGGPITRVTGFARTLSHSIEVEDTASAALEFASGALGVIQSTTAAAPGLYLTVEVLGDRGSAVIQDSEIVFWSTLDGGGPPGLEGPKTGSGTRDPMAFSHTGHLSQFRDLLDAIIEDRPPRVDGWEGRRTLEVVLAVYESSRTGAPVTLTQV